jgi:RNA polymerase sigma-70 factor (ECF subfamily)
LAAVAELEGLAAHRKAVRGLLLRLTRDAALADDLVQEALLRAVRAFPNLRGEASPGTWITAIALNLARDRFRAARRAPKTIDLNEAPGLAVEATAENEVLQAEMSACVLEHVAALPPRQRRVVLLHHFGGLDHAEIARQVGVSNGAARVILHRGLAALRGSLAEGCVLDFRDPIPCERRANAAESRISSPPNSHSMCR